jgi:hypothetical protein
MSDTATEPVPITDDSFTENVMDGNRDSESDPNKIMAVEIALMRSASRKNPTRLIATWDSGSVSNILNEERYFDTLDKSAAKIKFSNAGPNGSTSEMTETHGTGIASMYLRNTVNGKLTRIKFRAHYVPNISVNLLSTGYFLSRNIYWDQLKNELRSRSGKFASKFHVTDKNTEGSFMFALADRRDEKIEKDNMIINCATDSQTPLSSGKQHGMKPEQDLRMNN